MSSINASVRKKCKKCLEYVKTHFKCFQCDAVYHISCWGKVPGAYANQRGQLFCCRGLSSNYANMDNLGTQDNPPERVAEKGNIDNYNNDLENHLADKENSSLQPMDKQQKENHCREWPNKQDGSIRGLNKDKAVLVCSFGNKENVQKESCKEHIKRCDVESSDSRLNKDNGTCVTNTKRNPAQGDDKEKKSKHVICNYSNHVKICVVKYSNERSFKCDFCDYTTEESETLKSHFLSKHYDGKENYDSRVCVLSTRLKDAPLRHPQIHSSERPFKCDRCDYATALRKTLKLHIKRKHSNAEKQYKCSDCEYSTYDKMRLIKHKRNHTKERPFKCDWCDHTAAQKGNLKAHILKIHSKAKKEYKCTDCKYAAYDKMSLIKHKLNHSKERRFKCDMCHYAAAQIGNLEAHILNKHSKAKEEYKCTNCKYSTYDKMNLIKHKRNHTKQKPFRCEWCRYKTAKKGNLKTHILNEHFYAKKEYKCGDCEYSAYDKTSLIIHKHSHTKERPFKCHLCYYAAAQKGNLNAHILKKHPNAKQKYKCADCKYSAYDKSSLTKHKRNHTKKRPFKCSACDYAAAQKGNLNAHILKKHPNTKKRYKCADCNYSAYDKSSLIKHKRNHTKERPFKCKACDYAAAQKRNLKAHILRKHSHLQFSDQ